jgi:hypothetical protein
MKILVTSDLHQWIPKSLNFGVRASVGSVLSDRCVCNRFNSAITCATV